MMELRQVTKVYQQGRRTVEAVRGVSLHIAGGEFVSIMGPSGSGKSTLLHLLGALDTPTRGQALFHGRDLKTLSDRERMLLRRSHIGFVFQFFNLLQTLTAAENVALPLLLAGQGRKAAHQAALAVLQHVGLSDRAEHFPEEMSGGEMQRVAVARALVTEPEAILLRRAHRQSRLGQQPGDFGLAAQPAGGWVAHRGHGDPRSPGGLLWRSHHPPARWPDTPRTGVRGQGAEVRSPKSEVRSQPNNCLTQTYGPVILSDEQRAFGRNERKGGK